MNNPLSGPFSRDPFSPPSPHDKFGTCTEGNPAVVREGDDVSVLSQVFYHTSGAVKSPSPAALASPQGTGITGLGRPKV